MRTKVTSAEGARSASTNVSRQSPSRGKWLQVRCSGRWTLGHPAAVTNVRRCYAASQSSQLMSSWFTANASAEDHSSIGVEPPSRIPRRGCAWESIG